MIKWAVTLEKIANVLEHVNKIIKLCEQMWFARSYQQRYTKCRVVSNQIFGLQGYRFKVGSTSDLEKIGCNISLSLLWAEIILDTMPIHLSFNQQLSSVFEIKCCSLS